jgi:hypothetical protein
MLAWGANDPIGRRLPHQRHPLPELLRCLSEAATSRGKKMVLTPQATDPATAQKQEG